VKERTHLQSTTTSVTLHGFFFHIGRNKIERERAGGRETEVQAEKENGSIGIRRRGEYEIQWRRIREVCK
jgi:hypothetical protein